MYRLTFAIFLLTPTIAFSQGEACTAIASDIDRLTCYDAVLGKTPTPDQSPINHWNVKSTKSDFTDQTDVYITTTAETSPHCAYSQKPRLYVRCLEGETAAYVTHGCYAPTENSDTGEIEVELRVDKEPTKTRSPSVSTDNKAFGWWNNSSSRAFIRGNLLQKSKLVLRFEPYNESPVIIRFETKGLADVIASTSPSCDWAKLIN